MPLKLLRETKKFEIQLYRKPKEMNKLSETHVPFSGAPRKHTHYGDKIILVTDPFGGNPNYLEFNAEDISFAEELPSIVNLEGETVPMARVWVRKKSIAVRSTPFLVEDLRDIRSE